MGAITCPYCKASLSSQEIAEGWCDACGKRIPSYVTGELPDASRRSYDWARDRDVSYSRFGGKPLASRMARLGAAIVDGLLVAVVYAPGAVLVGIAGDNEGDPQMEALQMLGALVMLVGLIGIAVLQAVLLSMSGQTLGKKLTRVRIVRMDDGGNPGFVGAVLLRAIVPGFIGAIPCVGAIFSLIDVLFIFGEDRRCVHDLIASTKVVEA